MSDITIRRVRAICTRPAGSNLVVVRVDTSEPDLYGLGCATFTQRHRLVEAAVEEYLHPLLVGRPVSGIEELWRTMTFTSYWRNGPVLNNAVAGVDGALWDIKGKLAGMPVFELWGGLCRPAAAIYRHVSGADVEEVADSVAQMREQGVRHLRIQHSAGRRSYGGPPPQGLRPAGALEGHYMDARAYRVATLPLLEQVRERFGFDIEILHDVHERLHPAEAVEFAKQVEPLGLFFLEDPLAPEEIDWFHNLRRVCATPVAMGELFVHPNEWRGLVSARCIDFLRVHVSDIGGPTAALKAARVCEAFGVRTAWHGPGDLSPIGHMINLHLDLACPNFGIQECVGFRDPLPEVFPGLPEIRDGHLHPNNRPGWGVEIDEELAQQFPPQHDIPAEGQPHRHEVRLSDGAFWRY